MKSFAFRDQTGGISLAPLVLLGCLAVAGSALGAGLAVRSSMDNAVRSLTTAQLGLAKALSELPLGESQDRFVYPERSWAKLRGDLPAKYFCVIEDTGRIAYHSERADMLGRDVRQLPLPGEGPGTIGGLLSERDDWAGRNVSATGQEQIAAYAYSETLGGLIALHAPMESVETVLRAEVTPWLLSWVLATLAIPLILLALFRSNRKTRLELMRAGSREDALVERLRSEEKFEALGRLATGVAHDFNNMLAVILGHAQLTKKNLDTGNPLFEHVEAIEKSGERAARLTRQLLSISRQREVSSEILDLGDLIDGMRDLLGSAIRDGIELHVDTSDPVSQLVSVNPSKVEQAVLNLVLNARDAIQDEGQVRVTSRAVPLDLNHASMLGVSSGTYVAVTVEDTGNGIRKEDLGKVFEPFYTTKGEGRGSGLGLSSVLGTLRSAGGAVGVDSEPGRGTRFTLYFPQVQSA